MTDEKKCAVCMGKGKIELLDSSCPFCNGTGEFTKIALKIGAIKVIVLKHMQSDLCFYCRFGSGGHGKKSELPPMP